MQVVTSGANADTTIEKRGASAARTVERMVPVSGKELQAIWSIPSSVATKMGFGALAAQVDFPIPSLP